MIKFSVNEVREKGVVVGFRVFADYLPGGDEMFETFTHFALFAKQERAEAFLRSIEPAMRSRQREGRNCFPKEFWAWEGSAVSPLGSDSQRPVMETVARA